jgi:E3 ubiquitin-protein ligase HUWE1
VALTNGKTVHESVQSVNIGPQMRTADRPRPDLSQLGPQLLIELRMAILPAVQKLWESDLVEKGLLDVLSQIIELLKTVFAADYEMHSHRRADHATSSAVFKVERVPFNWTAVKEQVKLVEEATAPHPDGLDLVHEAIYRANGKREDALEYIRAHRLGIAGERLPVPDYDAFQEDPVAQVSSGSANPVSADAPNPDAMALDAAPNLNNFLNNALLNPLGDDDNMSGSHDSSEFIADDEAANAVEQPQVVINGENPALPAAVTVATETQDGGEKRPSVSKEDLDEARLVLGGNLIDRSLDVIRAHPGSVFEISELIQVAVLRSHASDKGVDLGETLLNALLSLASDDEEVLSANGPSIASFAHLLSLLLQDKGFFSANAQSLSNNIDSYLDLLKLPANRASDELPPWIPYILLIFEILLADDQQPPVESRWNPPKSVDDKVEAPVLVVKQSYFSKDGQSRLLDVVLDILPRIGKEDTLAVSVLRILVILTRNRALADTVGEKKNLQRLFVAAKQLAGANASILKGPRIAGPLMIVVRHIIEDEATIRQFMRFEIRNYQETNQRSSSRNVNDLNTYLRGLSHVALRSPNLFVEVTEEMLKISKWNSPTVGDGSRPSQLALKEPSVSEPSFLPPIRSLVAEAGRSDVNSLSLDEVRPSVEETKNDTSDSSKPLLDDPKRPMVENTDGVMHFIVSELLNYREVEDKEAPHISTDAQPTNDGSALRPGTTNGAASGHAVSPSSVSEQKDKKPSKQSFKAEEHPIFVYRCFLLNCLAELLQSYNRTKVEFINYKRGATLQTNTPIKPRASVLNYLLNDLLYLNSLAGVTDSTFLKKKFATATQAQQVLVALVSRTNEKSSDRRKDNYEYDDEPDLLFVRKFVLDTVLRSYKDAASHAEPLELRYGKMLALAELMSQMIGEKDRGEPTNTRGTDPALTRSQAQMKRLMYEKGYLSALTASVADIDLTFPNVKRTIKYILRVLRTLTKTAIHLSQSNIITSPTATADDAEEEIVISSSPSSELEEDREETPDLYRNSALGMMEPNADDLGSEHSEGDDGMLPHSNLTLSDVLTAAADDEDMYDDGGFGDEMEYEEEASADGEENVSDEDEELDDMGPIEGLPGDPEVVEVLMREDDDDDDVDDDDMDDDDEDEDGEDDDDVQSGAEDQMEMVDDEGNPIEDDGASGWESEGGEDDEEDSGDDDGDEDDEDGEIDFEAQAHDFEDEAEDFEALVRGREQAQARLAAMDGLIREVVSGDDYDGDEAGEDEDRYGDDGGLEDDGKWFEL